MTDDLKITPNLQKLVDNATTWELLTKYICSNLPTTAKDWAVKNNMKRNDTKNKGMDVCFWHQPVAQECTVTDDHQIDMVDEENHSV